MLISKNINALNRWSANVDKAGGWNNRNLTANDFEGQRQNREHDTRGGYQQGKGQGRGGYQPQYQQRARGRGDYQQQHTRGRGRGGYQQQQQPRQHYNNNNNEQAGWNSYANQSAAGTQSWGNNQGRNNAQTSWDKQSQMSTNNDWNKSPSSTTTTKSASDWDNQSNTSSAPAAAAWDRNNVKSSWDQKPQTSTEKYTPTSSGWDVKPDVKPATNLWAAQATTSAATPASASTPAQQQDDGWNTPTKSDSGGQWGTMTMDSLGWTETNKKPKDIIEPGQGIWKNGVHELGEESDEIKLKLFGTAVDHENIHSGINFDKYENIPVETKGENVPEGITEVIF